MIPATLVMLALWWWAARLRRRPGAPRVVGALPMVLLPVVSAGWTATLWNLRRASALARGAPPAEARRILIEHSGVARTAVVAVAAVLALALVVLVLAAWRTRHERPFASGNITGPG